MRCKFQVDVGDRWWGAGLSRLLVFVRYCWWNPPLQNLGKGIVQKSLVFPAQKMYNIPNIGSAMKSNKQTYFDLIESLINSPRDEQIAILQNNLELIDDNFTSVLREWANQTLAGMESEEATNITINILNFSNLIQEFLRGSKSSNMEIAIAGYEVARKIFNRYDDREKWAATQNNLGEAYRNRIKGEQGENIEQAIAFYEAALKVYSRAAFPQQWAGIQNNLANAYSNRIKENGVRISKRRSNFMKQHYKFVPAMLVP